MRKINVGLLGFGTVGSGFVDIFTRRASRIRARTGIDVRIKKICDKDIRTSRKIKVDRDILTTRPQDILQDPEIEIVVELIGGIHPAKEFIIFALNNKKYVVTANKALLAEQGKEIFETAEEKGVEIRFEASVGGGIPIIKALREGLVANRIESILGIINGTSNYILSQMRHENKDFKEALSNAQRKGYTETDPTLDIAGLDSAHKLAILASLCFGRWVSGDEVYVEGVQDISLSDVRYAEEFGYVIKPLAIARRDGKGLGVRVHPAMIPKTHLLASVDGAYNAIYVTADLVGRLLMYGKGAGMLPTANAVAGDVLDIAKGIGSGSAPFRFSSFRKGGVEYIKALGDIETRFYVRFSVIDKPSVLARISGILGKHKVSIATVVQKERRKAKVVPIVMMTHEAKESALKQAIKEIDKLSMVKAKSVAIRIEEG